MQASTPVSPDVAHYVEQVRKQGWCVVDSVVPSRDIAAIHDVVLAEEQRQTADREGWVRTSIGSADPRRNRKLSKAQSIIPKIGVRATFLLEPRYQSTLQSLLGEYLRVSSDFGIVTFPGNEREFWHADWPYNQTVSSHIPEPYGTTLMHLGSLVMLTDFTLENGGTMVLPGSHLFGHNPTGSADDAEASAARSTERQVTGSAGSVLIYDTRLWHSIAENRTLTPRVALAVRIAPWWLNLEVRRPGSTQARQIERRAAGRPTPVPLLSRTDYDALPLAVQPLYEHWVEGESAPPSATPDSARGVSSFLAVASADLRCEDEHQLPVSDGLLFDLRQTQYALPMTQLALDLGLFQYLEERPANLVEITGFLGCTPQASEAMLAVEASLGLLEAREDGRYGLGREARAYLLPTSPFYRPVLLGSGDRMLDRLRAAFTSDHDTSSPLAGALEGLAESEVRDFVDRMDVLARPAAVWLANRSLWSRMKRVLDVGGGAGAFCIAITQRHANVSCTLLERGPVGNIAAERVRRHRLSDRIAVIDRNMLTEKLPGGHDAILFSNIFHNWDTPTNQLLAQRAFAALNPGGVLVLHEVLLNPHKDGPLGAACFSVAMLLSHRGKQYTLKELQDILLPVGFVDCRTEPAFGRYHLISATKPVSA